jgi:hypothetical protein
MKKYCVIITCLFACFCGTAQHIPDVNFARGIRFQCPECLDSANNLTPVARTRTTLTVTIINITNLAGVEGFSSLNSLIVSNNDLTALPDNLPTGIRYLNINNNKITNLKSLPSNLRQLDCTNNQLTALPEFPASLLMINCSYNKITALPSLNNLTSLFCTNNLLTVIPPLPSALEGLICSYNQLKIIPPLPNPLIRLSCQHNPDLKCLPLLPEGLVYLDVSKNIACLPNVVKNLAVDLVEGLSITPINLPICNALKPPPCDTFPQQMPKDSTILGDKTPKIDIFPNPTEGEVKIKCQNCAVKKVLVFNAFGQLVMEMQAALIDIADLASGLYIIQVQTIAGDKTVKKIMKM